VEFKLPKLEEIMRFSTGFLYSLTIKARVMHLDIIKHKMRSPDGRRFPKLTPKYAKEKKRKYGNSDPNLFASGLMFKQIMPKKPKRARWNSDVQLSYGVKDGAMHPRNKGDQIRTADLLTFHAEAVPPNKFRPITGKAGSTGFSQQKAIHNETRDMLIKDLVNQINKNIGRALRPYRTKIDL
tara:strand:+ start:344 stop:889 length:546 start_codon:yes stop_codon:yes gene_type:complete